MKATDVLKKDNLLISFIKEHRGRENPASAKEIVQYMRNSGYSMSKTSVNPTLRKLMYERNLPICFISTHGCTIGHPVNLIFYTLLRISRKELTDCRHIWII